MRLRSGYNILDIDKQFAQHNLLNRFYYLLCMSLASLSKDQEAVFVWVVLGPSLLFQCPICLLVFPYVFPKFYKG